MLDTGWSRSISVQKKNLSGDLEGVRLEVGRETHEENSVSAEK